MGKHAEEIIGSLGNDAVEAFRNGGEWEWNPECGADGIAFAVRSEHGHWSTEYYIPGYRIESGVLYETMHHCDSDGDWNFEDECDVDSPDYPTFFNDYRWEEADKSWKHYARYVIETGTDPLGEYFVSRIESKPISITLRYCHPNTILFVSASDGKCVWTSPWMLPKKVRGYLSLRGWAVRTLSPASVGELAQILSDVSDLRIDGDTVSFTVSLEFRRDSHEVRKELIEVAKRGLKD